MFDGRQEADRRKLFRSTGGLVPGTRRDVALFIVANANAELPQFKCSHFSQVSLFLSQGGGDFGPIGMKFEISE
jgi:hypothetical protein